MTTLLLDGRPVPVKLVRNARARRLSLRIDPGDRSVVLVLPARAALSQGLAFAESKADWLRARLAAIPAGIPFVDGASLPLAGVPHRLRHDPAGRRGVWIEADEIHVSGAPEFLARRVTDWLKRRAREEIARRVDPMTATLGRPCRSIRLKDTRSRWGSCTSGGDLSFSWRLLLAPPMVLDYVVAHEVAHLAEMNHSPAFWRVVATLCRDAAAGRRWLKANGALLHRYGQA